VHTQVRELMTNYGKVDVLWYDGCRVPGSRTPGMWRGEGFGPEPAEFWRSEELNETVRELQPHILINSRSGLPEDFGTPEQYIRAEEAGRPWETCMTLNYPPGWGYLRHSMVNKTAAEVLFNLVDAVRLGGNFLFNVGPGPDGYLDDREGSVLEGIGRWMARHGQAVYGTRPQRIYDLSAGREQGPCFHYGMFTCKGSTAWLVLFYYPGSELVISKVAPAIRSAHLLTTGRELTVEPAANRRWRLTGLPQEPPDPLAPVVQIEFEGPPHALNDRGAGWLAGRFGQ
jgi:alpha-L-fucosidase